MKSRNNLIASLTKFADAAQALNDAWIDFNHYEDSTGSEGVNQYPFPGHAFEEVNYKIQRWTPLFKAEIRDGEPQPVPIFPNGFINWTETYFEIVHFVLHNIDKGYIATVREAGGLSALYDVARDWADKFEKQHEDHPWDGEYLDEIETFCEEMNKY